MKQILGSVLTALLAISAIGEASSPFNIDYDLHNGILGARDSKSTVTTSTVTSTNQTLTATAPTDSAALQSAILVVQDAQSKQGKLNQARYRNPAQNIYKLRPSRSSHRENLSSSVPSNVAKAARLVGEHEARKNPHSKQHQKRASFWMESMNHGSVAVGGSSGYVVFRNVKDYGAVGDGLTDDTVAINNAISSGSRCGDNCGSSTVSPAIVYFPSGTYLISSPIIGYYNTQLIGNANTPPTIKGSASFIGLGMISSDVYIPGASGSEWYINQNNFLRQVRNFILDTTSIPNHMNGIDVAPAGIHWQVAQATSLQAITINMPTSADTTHVGIFMENGSGGFMTDVTFNGGKTGAILGNQQFTVRNFKFSGCQTAVEMLWDWAFTMKSFDIENCQVGFNASGGGGGASAQQGQGTGSITIIDTKIANTATGILTSVSGTNATSILLENVQFSGVGVGVSNKGATALAGGSQTINNWASGSIYDNAHPSGNGRGKSQDTGTLPSTWTKPSSLLGTNGWFERSKPQYGSVAASGFSDVKSVYGCKGNGRSDDTACLNTALATTAANGQILWIPYGTYLVTDTIKVPPGAKIVGEIWPQIMGSGSKFSDMNNPYPMVQVGQKGDTGNVEMQDLMFTVRGATAGAILLEWNIKESSQGSAGLWDCHFRVGGAVGSNLQAANCPKLTGAINPNCIAASLHMHIKGSGYFENMWVWTADHDMDLVAQTQINVYTARGVLIESAGPLWLYGTASEHNVLYQYQILDSSNVFLGLIQTESPYYQGVAPAGAPAPFGNTTIASATTTPYFGSDPNFNICYNDPLCATSWALRILSSDYISIYGAGLYSWFQNYDQTCLASNKCQTSLAYIDDQSSEKTLLYNLVTVGAQVMMTTLDGVLAWGEDNKNGFASSVLAFLITTRAVTSTAHGSVSDLINQSKAVVFSDKTTADGDGSALVILSTIRYQPVFGNGLEQTAFEYWGLTSDQKADCGQFTGQSSPAGMEITRSNTWATSNVIPDKPDQGPPDKSRQAYNFLKHSCQFTRDSFVDWGSAAAGAQVGHITCDGGFEEIPCTKPTQPSQGSSVCSLLEYTVDAVCYLTTNSLQPRAGTGGKPALQLWEISVALMLALVRPAFYRPNRQLFYTRRLSWAVGQTGLSDTARDFALHRRLQTIWDGWPTPRIDGDSARYYDFYNVDDPNGWLRDIRQTNFIGDEQNGDAQNQYFQAMSKAFALEAVGTVYVMTEDPTNIPMTAIWGEVEFPTLTRAGTPVTEIIALDETGLRWYKIWDKNDSSITPRNPKRVPAPTNLKKRKVVTVGGQSVNIGGDGSETSRNSYGDICLNSGLWWEFPLFVCPGPASVMRCSEIEKGRDFFG
ncbi:hypothetical protein H072_5254 [Dactylellina haptotyla CBS 200.50]|uniref:Rhamnogalacturonase A/B/Epimerase-like pectate lyase domain-containing protein n=1 Tax=Dactylellina haptotyla (strain CBS 200.50) TaxID=1284197 RepID=S8AD48_DACHA|nr:hypothetical protein H072_5254 [Dactylellina haptotyla CBS 200.50]